MEQLGSRARRCSRQLRFASTQQKNNVLLTLAGLIECNGPAIIKANQLDLDAARQRGTAESFIDRLALNDERIAGMIEGLKQVAALPDPVGEISEMRSRPSGISVGKMRSPLGVIGIIYESRPNVTIEAASLCLKAGNSAILRGGSEAINSNLLLASYISAALAEHGLDEHCVQVVPTTDRQFVDLLISSPGYVDVIIPRGGKGLIERIANNARVPVIKHLDGICHTYVDRFADIAMACKVALNAKTQRFGTCNTMETLLVHSAVAADFLPRFAKDLLFEGVELRGCAVTQELVAEATPATEDDWSTEYLAPILSIRVVDSFSMAVEHIEQYSSGHTEVIITQDYARARNFLAQVDSSSVMVNASSRFADGFEYGLGAEIGISTDKFHCRGPVGLEGLTSQKWIVMGDGHIRT